MHEYFQNRDVHYLRESGQGSDIESGPFGASVTIEGLKSKSYAGVVRVNLEVSIPS